MLVSAASGLLRTAVRTRRVPTAHLQTKPARDKLTFMDQTIAMTVLFATILGPSGWVLSHLEDYKKKQ